MSKDSMTNIRQQDSTQNAELGDRLGSLNILIVDEQAMVRDAMDIVLRDLADTVTTHHANSIHDAKSALQDNPQTPFDLVLYGLSRYGDEQDRSAIAFLAENIPNNAVAALSQSENAAEARAVLSHGARAYIPKTAGTNLLIAALRCVLSGGSYIPGSVVRDTFDVAPNSEESGANLRNLAYDQVDVGIIAADLDGLIREWNATAQSFTGVPAQDMIGTSLDEAYDILGAGGSRTAIHDNLVLAGKWSDEILVNHRKGTGRQCELTVLPLTNERNDPSGTLLALKDISTWKRAESNLRGVRDFLTDVVDKVNRLILVVDAEGRIVRYNEACRNTTGYTFMDVRGRRFWDQLVPVDERENVRMDHRSALHGESHDSFVRHLVNIDGTTMTVEWSTTPLVNAVGAVEYVVWMGRETDDAEAAAVGNGHGVAGASSEAERQKIRTRLTKRQRQVLGLIAEGCSNRTIAQQLGLTEATVKLHVRAVLKGLEVENRTQAALMATRAGVYGEAVD
jgi:PAS domain S-box-containing protein